MSSPTDDGAEPMVTTPTGGAPLPTSVPGGCDAPTPHPRRLLRAPRQKAARPRRGRRRHRARGAASRRPGRHRLRHERPAGGVRAGARRQGWRAVRHVQVPLNDPGGGRPRRRLLRGGRRRPHHLGRPLDARLQPRRAAPAPERPQGRHERRRTSTQPRVHSRPVPRPLRARPRGQAGAHLPRGHQRPQPAASAPRCSTGTSAMWRRWGSAPTCGSSCSRFPRFCCAAGRATTCPATSSKTSRPRPTVRTAATPTPGDPPRALAPGLPVR